MKFDVNITGSFNNIKGMRIAQRFFMDVVCGACNHHHDKLIFINKDNQEDYHVKNNKFKIEHCNLLMKCKNANCDNKFNISLVEPESKIIYDEENEDGYTHPIKDGKCHISTIKSHSAVIKKIDGLILNVVSNDNEVFRNCDFNERVLAEDNNKGEPVYVTDFKIEVVQVN